MKSPSSSVAEAAFALSHNLPCNDDFAQWPCDCITEIGIDWWDEFRHHQD